MQTQALQDTSDQLLHQLIDSHGLKTTMKSLAQMSGYEEVPPTIHEFVNGDDFLKDSLWNEEKDKTILYPIWQSALKEIYPNPFYKPYKEILCTGSLGGGKTTVCKIGALYDITKVSYLKNPQTYYNLGPTTKLVYALYSETLKSAKGVLLDEVLEWAQTSPYLKSLITNSKGKTLFAKNIDIIEGSRFTHTIGQAVMGTILSELNFQNKIADQAYKNYTALKRRGQTRFLGRLPGHMWLDSSKTDETGFLEAHMKKVSGDPEVRIFDNAIWQAKPHEYSGKTFKVFFGDSLRDPFVIEHPRQVLGLDEACIIDAPIEHYQDFKDDIYNSLQDIAGRSTSSVHKFISSVERIEECLIRQNPVVRDIIKLDFYNKDDTLMRYVSVNDILKVQKPRFLHVDLGLRGDTCGIAMSCVVGFVTITRRDAISGLITKSQEPIFYTDLVIGLRPKSGQEVPIYKIKGFVSDLVKLGVPIVLVTADGYQSENLKQDLWLMGINSKIISVDAKRGPYDNLKNIILEGRYNGVQHPVLQRELKELLDLGKKIDHPAHSPGEKGQEKGSKDLADAICGSCWSAYENLDKYVGSVVSDEFIQELDREIVEESSLYNQIFNHRSAIISVVEDF